MKDEIFQELESNVRSYCRTFPVVFGRAQNAHLWSEDGRKFIDFFAGAGALNYGHNNPFIKQRVLEYLADDHVLHALDMHTTAKRAFLQALKRYVLEPKGLEYRVQFTGPTAPMRSRLR